MPLRPQTPFSPAMMMLVMLVAMSRSSQSPLISRHPGDGRGAQQPGGQGGGGAAAWRVTLVPPAAPPSCQVCSHTDRAGHLRQRGVPPPGGADLLHLLHRRHLGPLPPPGPAQVQGTASSKLCPLHTDTGGTTPPGPLLRAWCCWAATLARTRRSCCPPPPRPPRTTSPWSISPSTVATRAWNEG